MSTISSFAHYPLFSKDLIIVFTPQATLATMSDQADWTKMTSSEIENIDDPEKEGVEGSGSDFHSSR